MSLTYGIFKDDQLVKTITAKGMNSIYNQYKKYCWNRHATNAIVCSNDQSVGMMYWSDSTNNYYLKQL